MDFATVIIVEMLYAIALLVLISAGLAVIFGMMRVINLAHGEMLTLGGYAAIVSNQAGVPIYISMMIIAPVITALFGLIVERVIVRHLYGRLINTMLATWGLSLAMMGAFTMIFGNTTTGIATPISGFTVGNYQISGYNLFVVVVSILLMLGVYMALKYTRAGLVARAVMQNPDMAGAFGTNPNWVYMITFTAGSALAGLAGGVLAPLVGISPSSGGAYIADAFITVISGGTSVIAGTLAAASLFGIVSQAITFLSNPVVGDIALMVTALVLLRLLPTGITGRFLKNRV